MAEELGKVNIFNLGEKGVVNAKDPIHVIDGELLQSQNAIANNPDEGLGGLEKRGGMAKLNTVAMSGAVLGLANVPLEDPVSGFGEWIYVGGTQGGISQWCGASYDFLVNFSNFDTLLTADIQPAGARTYTKIAGAFPGATDYRSTSIARANNKLFYAADGYTVDTEAPPIRCWTGKKDFEIARIPEWFDAGVRRHAKAIVRLITFDTFIYLSTWDGGTSPDTAGRVFRLDPETGTLLQIGEAFGGQAGEIAGGFPFSLVSWNGRLWVGTANAAAAPAGKVLWIRPGLDDAWTLDHTMTAGQGNVLALAGFSVTGNLYVGVDGVGGVAGLVLARTPSGVWSTSDTGLQTSARNRYDVLVEFEEKLYAFYWDPTGGVGAANRQVIRSFDGAAWTTARDILVTDHPAAVPSGGAGALVLPGMLLIGFIPTVAYGADNVLRRMSSGVWHMDGTNSYDLATTTTVLGFIRSDDILNPNHFP